MNAKTKAAALADATAYMDGLLKEGLDAEAHAAWVMEHSQGPDEATGVWALEIPSRWTKSGNPQPFDVRLPVYRVFSTRTKEVLWEGIDDDEALAATLEYARERDEPVILTTANGLFTPTGTS